MDLGEGSRFGGGYPADMTDSDRGCDRSTGCGDGPNPEPAALMDTVDTARVAPREPAWVTHAVWWHLYPLGFTGADTTGQQRQPARGLSHIADWLDYCLTSPTQASNIGSAAAARSSLPPI